MHASVKLMLLIASWQHAIHWQARLMHQITCSAPSVHWPHACSCHMSGDAYKNIIHSCLAEVQSGYSTAAKQAIIDYVLRSPTEQRRLGLQALGPLVAQQRIAEGARALVANRDLPDWWHQSVAVAREEMAWTLQTLSANALELNDLWIMQGFSSR